MSIICAELMKKLLKMGDVTFKEDGSLVLKINGSLEYVDVEVKIED